VARGQQGRGGHTKGKSLTHQAFQVPARSAPEPL
jgi:hypothetical protein